MRLEEEAVHVGDLHRVVVVQDEFTDPAPGRKSQLGALARLVGEGVFRISPGEHLSCHAADTANSHDHDGELANILREEEKEDSG